MRISVIGPTYPFRGGISHYTTLLVRKLRSLHEVQFISYSRQYPAWLYPGGNDRDPSKVFVLEESPDLTFDALNPWQWWTISSSVGARLPGLVILPWSAVYWAPFYLVFLKGIRRFRNIKVLFICHNVFEHEPNYLKSAVSKMILRKGDFYIAHSQWDKGNLVGWIGKQRESDVRICVHPLYQPISQHRFDKKDALRKLGIGAERVLLFFGFIREYKGLEYLLRSIPLVLDAFPIHLVIAGEVWGDSSQYTDLILKLGISNHVTFINRYIANEEVPIFFDAADLVVIPYVSATQSGVVQLSHGFGKPVVVGNVGGLPEAVEDGRTGYLVSPRSPEAIAMAVIDFFQNGRESDMVNAIKILHSADSWLVLNNAIEELVRSP